MTNSADIMNQADVDAHSLQMWLASSSLAPQAVMVFPTIQNPAVMPYLIGQAYAPSLTSLGNLPDQDSLVNGKKRKRKSKGNLFGDKEQNNNNNAENIGNRDVTTKTESTEQETHLNGLHPAFDQNETPKLDRLPAVFVRNTCRLCGKFFRSGQLLRQHMLVHTDKRKYQCQYCDRAFKQLSHLQQHHRIHTGEKPYKCQIEGCNRSFPQLSNLQHHYRNHDKPEPPSDRVCMFCDRVYCSEVVLRNHIMKIHLSSKNPLMTQLTKDTELLEKPESIASDDTGHPSASPITKPDTVTLMSDKSHSDISPANLLTKTVGDKDHAKKDTNCSSDSFLHIFHKKEKYVSEIGNKIIKVQKASPLDQLSKDIENIEHAKDFVTDMPLPRLDKMSPVSHIEENLISKTCSNNDNETAEEDVTGHQYTDDAQTLSDNCRGDGDMSTCIFKNDVSADKKKVEIREERNDYDCIMEEMNRKVANSKDLGCVYNYILDSINETTQSTGSPYFFNNISVDNADIDPFGADNSKTSIQGAACNPKGMGQYSDLSTSQKDTTVVPSQSLHVSMAVNGALGRARKRKAFFPQRIQVGDFV